RRHIAPHLKPFLDANPDLELHLDLSDAFVDIVAEGYDLASRIGELPDSSLVARRLAPVHRVLCATPADLAAHGTPAGIGEISRH
ncbi:LysR substrate-binding domain-containing protein, partial [Acinetobacter baumannii]